MPRCTGTIWTTNPNRRARRSSRPGGRGGEAQDDALRAELISILPQLRIRVPFEIALAMETLTPPARDYFLATLQRLATDEPNSALGREATEILAVRGGYEEHHDSQELEARLEEIDAEIEREYSGSEALGSGEQAGGDAAQRL